MIYIMIPLTPSPSAVVGYKIENDNPLNGKIITCSNTNGLKYEHFTLNGDSIMTPLYHIPFSFLYKFMYENGCVDDEGRILKDNCNYNENNLIG